MGENGLLLRAPGMQEAALPFGGKDSLVLRVVMQKDICYGIDQGNELADWLSEFLRESCRLVGSIEEYPRERPLASVLMGIPLLFTDAYPVLVISEESLDDLNSRMPQPLPVNRFRPNIVVSACKPYEEDRWEQIRIGGVPLYGARQCVRCAITTIDQGYRCARQGTSPDPCKV